MENHFTRCRVDQTKLSMCVARRGEMVYPPHNYLTMCMTGACDGAERVIAWPNIKVYYRWQVWVNRVCTDRTDNWELSVCAT
jgi:hypothetical protein